MKKNYKILLILNITKTILKYLVNELKTCLMPIFYSCFSNIKQFSKKFLKNILNVSI